jgi:MFS family permease
MDNTSPPAGSVRWTLADFLSSYSFWALFFSSFLLSAAGQGLITLMPLVASEAGISHQSVAFAYSGMGVGWVFGAFIAFVVATRHPRAALVWPLAVCALVTLLMFMSGLIGSVPVLLLFAVAYGAVNAVFPLALAILLLGGRPTKTDFGSALVLLSATALLSYIAPAGMSLLFASSGFAAVVLAFILCLLVAMILVFFARDLGFDGAPRGRHKPIPPRQRSPFVVAAILFSPVVFSIFVAVGTYIVSPQAFSSSDVPGVVYLLSFLVFLVSVGAFVYLAYWVYRIHGELAGAAPSQRLLTPLAALPVGIFVPLGLPVLVMTLGDLLNDRAAEKGRPRLISIAWLAIWTLILPPIGIAMIQSAANRSYAMDADVTSDPA